MSFANATALQLRTIKTLVLRRFQTRHSDSRAGYTWALIEPMIWVFVLKFGISGGNHASTLPPLGTSYETFFATGVVIARTWRTVTPTIGKAANGPNKNTLPFITKIDQAYAIWILDMITGGVVIIIILTILSLWGIPATPADPLTCIVAYIAFSIFTLAFALALAVATILIPILKRLQGIIMMVMFFTSGFATLLDRMPPAFRDIVVWNPLVHLIEWFREGFYPGYECYAKDLSYVLTVTICCLLFGLVGERAFRRRNAAMRER